MNPIKALYTFVSIFTGEYEREGFRKRDEAAMRELAQVAHDVRSELDRLIRPLPHVMREALLDTAHDIICREFSEERFRLSLAFQPATLGDYPALLRKTYETDDLVSLFIKPFNEACEAFLLRLPRYIGEKGVGTLFLEQALSESAILDFDVMLAPDRLFHTTIMALRTARYKLDDDIKAKLIGRDSPESVSRLMAIALPRMMRLPVPVRLPQDLRFEGTWMVAPSGRGKTTLMGQLLALDLDQVRDGMASVILMDSKGELIDHAKRLKRFAPGGDLEGKLVLIEPTPDLALNPLDLGGSEGHSLDLTEYLLDGLLDTATTPKQGGVFRRVLIAMQAIPGATFETFIGFLDDWKPFEHHLQKLDHDDLKFFTSGKYDEKKFKETRTELYWRIDALITKVPLMRSMFKSPSTNLDIGKEMDSGKVIIIDNRERVLSSGLQFYSRFFVSLILAAAQRRASRDAADKLPCYVYIDECHDVVANEKKVATILHQCRSQKIGLILAHQNIKQLASDDVKEAVANCAIRFANSDKDAKALADDLRTTSETLQSLRKGKFALFMRDLTKTALVIDVPNEPVSSWPKMSDDEFRAIQAEMKRYCYTPAFSSELPETPQSPDTQPEKWG